MMRLALLKTGSTYPAIRSEHGDFEQWFLRELPAGAAVQVVNVAAGQDPGAPAHWDGVLVTGSPTMVTDREPWSERAAAWLARAVGQGVPVLGVCYGHHLLAHAMGGAAGYREQGRESGTFGVQLLPEAASDPLFGELPSGFPAHLTHAQSVLRLPPDAVLLARSDGEPHQAFRLGRHAWGVQFHPEFDATIMRAYLQQQASALAEEGQDPGALLAQVREAPEATGLLARFADYVGSRARTGA
ncbi:MAG: glutamine amidotransferase [Ectothiorhodospiraceae bacterium]|nr:glutamine amidotransferase [Ectothiorhodospiraceae bacterium]MCH8504135.1 glutamine amidotransferase [Ectothiorhodospiraceae bacterium]